MSSLFPRRSAAGEGSRWGICLLALLLVLLDVDLTFATRVQRLTLTQLRDKAESVVLGTVVEVSTRRGERGMVWTDYHVELDETLKGAERGGRIVVSFAGGRHGDADVGIAGVPVLTRGETYVLFLLPEGPFPSATVGWGQGIFRRIEALDAGQEKTLLVSFDGEPLQRTSEGKLRRGGRIEVADGVVRSAADVVPGRPEAPREQDPVLLLPDGTVSPSPPAVEHKAASVPIDREYASLDDLRQFLAGKIEEIGREEQEP